MHRSFLSVIVAAFLCIAGGMSQLNAQSFSFGFDIAECGTTIEGNEGDTVTIEGLLTLAATGFEPPSGVGGWTQGVSVVAPGLVWDEPVVEQCDTACKEGLINSPVNHNLNVFAVLPTTGFIVDPTANDNQGEGLVDATLLQIGQQLPAVTINTLRIKFDATIPAGSEDITLTFQDGLKGPGQKVNNTVSFSGSTRPVDELSTCTITLSSGGGAETNFIRGDVDHSGRVNLTDAVNTVLFAFQGNPIPCVDAADSNDDGITDGSDAVWTLTYVFLEGTAPPAPFPSAGADPTEDELGCETGV